MSSDFTHSNNFNIDASNPQQSPPQPTRTKTFFRQNQYKTGTKIFVPFCYLVLSIFYFHSLLFRRLEAESPKLSPPRVVGSQEQQQQQQQQQDNVDKDSNLTHYATAKGDNVMLQLEPRSLAHVVIPNAEIVWRNHVDWTNYLRRQAKQREERAQVWRMKQQQILLHEDKQQQIGDKISLLRGGVGSKDVNDTTKLTKNNNEGSKSSNKSTSATTTEKEEELEVAVEHLKNIINGNNNGSISFGYLHILKDMALVRFASHKIPSPATPTLTAKFASLPTMEPICHQDSIIITTIRTWLQTQQCMCEHISVRFSNVAQSSF